MRDWVDALEFVINQREQYKEARSSDPNYKTFYDENFINNLMEQQQRETPEDGPSSLNRQEIKEFDMNDLDDIEATLNSIKVSNSNNSLSDSDPGFVLVDAKQQ